MNDQLASTTLRTTAVAFVLALSSATGFASDDRFDTASDVLAAGLPLVAAGISYAQDDRAGLYQLAKSEAATVAFTELLKHSTQKTRPNGRDDKSFPSGHTAVAFAAAQYMQTRVGWEAGVPAYVAASLVGYSRVRADQHYWRDVVVGAALGIGSSMYFTEPREKSRFSVLAAPGAAYVHYFAAW